MIWLAVGAADGQGEAMERLLPQLASILRFTRDLERRLAGDGLGLAAVRDLHRRIADLLTGLAPDVALGRQTVADLVTALRTMEQTLAALRRLKAELGRAP